ncbi:MAG: chondroitinase-B domain-containing protein [Verrucomicrobium sp.]
MRHPKFHVLALLAALLPWRGEAADIAVADATQFEVAVQRCQSGDVVILQDGSWKDVNLLFKGKGTAASPVTLRAATPGRVEISGNSQLRLAGEHLQVEGLWFRNAVPTAGDVITFREDSKNLAKNCRVTQCAITQEAGLGDAKDRKWVSIYGQGNQVDHCHFSGKTGKGTLLVVWLEQGVEAGHVIEASYTPLHEDFGIG